MENQWPQPIRRFAHRGGDGAIVLSWSNGVQWTSMAYLFYQPYVIKTETQYSLAQQARLERCHLV